jgi:hypothetical protein
MITDHPEGAFLFLHLSIKRSGEYRIHRSRCIAWGKVHVFRSYLT